MLNIRNKQYAGNYNQHLKDFIIQSAKRILLNEHYIEIVIQEMNSNKKKKHYLPVLLQPVTIENN